ncbi:replication initiation protein RepC [Tropicibacter naphthalenivorans]|uniref:Replication initiation protein RepC n=2 Tax=Tropicibacter naphthalenivorans TaxID=441103 RepID=A0A0P1GHL7_9RHOB|nr:replication initiation protein RepC [Tropicibacter naphthalenivorans]SMC97171.1 replication initiation protein RepC [Tropicibacter naphthalenivorans]
MKQRAQAQQGSDLPCPVTSVDKWEALRELSAARTAFGLSDRDMTVLQALISFHPKTVLEGDSVIVHPSNASISERLGGMPESTLRRHLSRLVAAGVLMRRDSPNGKRYARGKGDSRTAFGFDLAPLVRRHALHCAAAEELRAEAERVKRLRETVSLMRRDLAGLAEWGADQRPDLTLWDAFEDLALLTARALRRKLDEADLHGLAAQLSRALDQARNLLEPTEVTEETSDMSGTALQSERHYQNSNIDSSVLEPSIEKEEAAPEVAPSPPQVDQRPLPSVPLGLVLNVCPEIQGYLPDPIRHWHQLVNAADTLRPMMGISPSAWQEAQAHMGPEQAAVVLAAMLERMSDIKSPGGYLRALTDKAAAGAFSCGPMIMALMRKAA